MNDIQLFLDDPEKRVLAGIPEKTRKIINPFYEATELEREGKRKEAERIYVELMNADFENPALQAALGMNYALAEKNGLAYLLLMRAYENIDQLIPGLKRLGINPKAERAKDLDTFKQIKKSEILNALGTCFKHENRTTEARQYFEMAQVGIPDNPDIQNNLGTLYINEGKPEAAMEHLNRALAVDPNHAQAHWNMSLAYLELGDYKNGWENYDYGMAAKVRMDRQYGKEPLPIWDGTPGKNVIIYGEQGIGDEILFASCLQEAAARCKSVVFECHRKLHRLFANSFPDIPCYPTREDEVIGWPLNPDGSKRYHFDAKIAIGSLPRLFRNKLEDFPGTPFLQPEPKSELYWNEMLAKLPRKPNIGISWIGGHKRTRVEVRSIALERLLPILSQDANFISLQYTPCEDEIQQLKEKHGITLHHWQEACYSSDYNDTAGLVANLDLVITVATSVMHLAGSMGVPCWTMVASRAAWREYYSPNDSIPWYKSIVVFKQEQGSIDWEPVINEVADNLRQLLEAK